ncbi:MAG: sodium:calcium antiporter, partial [Acidothermus cellulolyticus]|nr:sodium:calcium antiporter [Acidothermus cellulolyticus]
MVAIGYLLATIGRHRLSSARLAYAAVPYAGFAVGLMFLR